MVGERTRPACWGWRLAEHTDFNNYLESIGGTEIASGEAPDATREARVLPKTINYFSRSNDFLRICQSCKFLNFSRAFVLIKVSFAFLVARLT